MIFGRHSVLKRGCSTWYPQQVPQAEFQTRLELVRKEIARCDLDALVIYGDNYSFGDLCYLTNYFPKVRGGIAVVPRDGAISLLLNIGSRDVPFAKTLTWGNNWSGSKGHRRNSCRRKSPGHRDRAARSLCVQVRAASGIPLAAPAAGPRWNNRA